VQKASKRTRREPLDSAFRSVRRRYASPPSDREILESPNILILKREWCARQDSNLRPSAPQDDGELNKIKNLRSRLGRARHRAARGGKGRHLKRRRTLQASLSVAGSNVSHSCVLNQADVLNRSRLRSCSVAVGSPASRLILERSPGRTANLDFESERECFPQGQPTTTAGASRGRVAHLVIPRIHAVRPRTQRRSRARWQDRVQARKTARQVHRRA
jgi:hypothetical protein